MEGAQDGLDLVVHGDRVLVAIRSCRVAICRDRHVAIGKQLPGGDLDADRIEIAILKSESLVWVQLHGIVRYHVPLTVVGLPCKIGRGGGLDTNGHTEWFLARFASKLSISEDLAYL